MVPQESTAAVPTGPSWGPELHLEKDRRIAKSTPRRKKDTRALILHTVITVFPLLTQASGSDLDKVQRAGCGGGEGDG